MLLVSLKISKFNIFLRVPFINFAAPTSSDAIVPETEKLFMEGRIVQKLECRPYGTSNGCTNRYIYASIFLETNYVIKFF